MSDPPWLALAGPIAVRGNSGRTDVSNPAKLGMPRCRNIYRPAVLGGSMRSLVIEDEPQIGAYVGRLLGQLHGIVDIVASVSDAQQALSSFKYDLAIVDRMLPD